MLICTKFRQMSKSERVEKKIRCERTFRICRWLLFNFCLTKPYKHLTLYTIQNHYHAFDKILCGLNKCSCNLNKGITNNIRNSSSNNVSAFKFSLERKCVEAHELIKLSNSSNGCLYVFIM